MLQNSEHHILIILKNKKNWTNIYFRPFLPFEPLLV